MTEKVKKPQFEEMTKAERRAYLDSELSERERDTGRLDVSPPGKEWVLGALGDHRDEYVALGKRQRRARDASGLFKRPPKPEPKRAKRTKVPKRCRALEDLLRF